jgi:dTDP-4-amino-4,6-dideoxygalactose transaminase
MRPRLPVAEKLAPYLRRIDANRYYSNSGPLLGELEGRLAAHFGVKPENVACVANATVGLTLCLMALPAPGGLACILPSWTFEASAVAIRAAGLEPWFHEVNEQTWALDPDTVRRAMAGADRPVAAVMPVCPFGAPIPTTDWDDFSERTGIPVVIDAAAAFDGLIPGRSPCVLSLHATKVLSTGEGGAVISTDPEIVAKVRSLANFGFERVRRIERAGVNAKLSEHAAAIGLAAFDDWPQTQSAITERSRWYVELLPITSSLTFAPGFGTSHVQPTCNIRLLEPRAAALIDGLAMRGIGARKWWGEGCHRQPAFADSQRMALPVTEKLAASVVGLPFFVDISRAQIGEVAQAVGAILRQNT